MQWWQDGSVEIFSIPRVSGSGLNVVLLALVHFCNLQQHACNVFIIIMMENFVVRRAAHTHTQTHTCWLVVASSGFLSSLILRNRGNRKEIPFSGST